MWNELFEAHPGSVGETYLEHRKRAFGFAGRLLVAGAACVLHGLVPGLCATTASRTVSRLHAEMAARAAQPAMSAVGRTATGSQQA